MERLKKRITKYPLFFNLSFRIEMFALRFKPNIPIDVLYEVPTVKIRLGKRLYSCPLPSALNDNNPCGIVIEFHSCFKIFILNYRKFLSLNFIKQRNNFLKRRIKNNFSFKIFCI